MFQSASLTKLKMNHTTDAMKKIADIARAEFVLHFRLNFEQKKQDSLTSNTALTLLLNCIVNSPMIAIKTLPMFICKN